MKILIIGGGLSGLTLAYLLGKNNISTQILEASSRLGGRIETLRGKQDTPLELGATWVSDGHHYLLELIKECGLSIYPQYTKGKSLFQTHISDPPQEFFVQESQNNSYRIAGGTSALITALSNTLVDENILLNTKVTVIEQDGQNLMVKTNSEETFKSDIVVLCLPPQLIGSSIRFNPALPSETKAILPTVQTWMAGSIKLVLEYSKAFWRDKGLSGMIYSHPGIISEIYDHTNYEEDKFGFTGFLNAGVISYLQEVRRKQVLDMLSSLIGEEAKNPLYYNDKVWTGDYILGNNNIIPMAHYNNSHPCLQRSYMNGKLFFSGTETSKTHPGYMEGAVQSAVNAYKKLLNQISH